MTATIHHADLYGSRQSKYRSLHESGLKRIAWEMLMPNAPDYTFRPREQAYRGQYEEYWKITDAFPANVLGFQTHRDQLAIGFDINELYARLSTFCKLPEDEARKEFDLGNWTVNKAQIRLRVSPEWESITSCLYRPFDTRFCYYNSIVVDRPRTELLRNVLNRNSLCFGVGRQGLAIHEAQWSLVTISRTPVDANVFRRGGVNLFPLWRYPSEQEAAIGMEREANISPKFLAELNAKIGSTPTPEEIFHYAYAVFYAPTYRTRFAAFLKTDFPRLPLPPDVETFHELAKLGAKLTALHLLEDPSLNRHGIGYKGGGGHVVKKIREVDRYVAPSDGATGRVRLNDNEYFDNVPPEAWEFQVGGYRPAAKWLDDRKDRALTEDDIAHYRRMIAAMRDTAALLPAVDAAFQPILTVRSVDVPK